MSDNKLPKILSNRADLKSLTLESLNAAIEALNSGELPGISTSGDTKLIVFTNFGIIEGRFSANTMPTNEEITADPSSAMISVIIDGCFQARNNKLVELEEEFKDIRLVNDTSSIVLEDATITPYANPSSQTKVKSFILFADQIAGISFGVRS